MFALRPYQETLEQGAKNALRVAESVCLVAPTGAGKTVIFTRISWGCRQRGNSVWIVVHRDELIDQVSRALLRQGVRHGIIGAGIPYSAEPIQVVSVDTMIRQLERHQPPTLLIIDECHHAAAGKWRKLIDFCRAGGFTKILGVTATPMRLDGAGLDDIFDELVLGPTVRALIDQNFLAEPEVIAAEDLVDLAKVAVKHGEYVQEELERALDIPMLTGNAVDHYNRFCPGEQAMIFARSVADAEYIAKRFNDAGISAVALDGKTPKAVRKRRIAEYVAGRILVLVSCDLFSEGFDLGDAAPRVGFFMRPTMSFCLYRQQAGRVIRNPDYPKPRRALLIDLVGNVFRHGFPDEEPLGGWTLEGRAKSEGSGAKIERARQCPKCYHAFKPAPICPYCGHVFKPKSEPMREREGELVKVDRDLVRQLREAQAKEQAKLEAEHEALEKRRNVAKAKTLIELYMVARELGYKPKWAEIRYERNFAQKQGGLSIAKAHIRVASMVNAARVMHALARQGDLCTPQIIAGAVLQSKFFRLTEAREDGNGSRIA